MFCSFSLDLWLSHQSLQYLIYILNAYLTWLSTGVYVMSLPSRVRKQPILLTSLTGWVFTVVLGKWNMCSLMHNWFLYASISTTGDSCFEGPTWSSKVRCYEILYRYPGIHHCCWVSFNSNHDRCWQEVRMEFKGTRPARAKKLKM